MFWQKILPGMLKELLRHVPTVFFQVVEWGEITSEVPQLSRRILQKEGFLDFFERQKAFLSPLQIKISAGLNEERVSEFNRESGIHLLEIYFGQVFSPHGLFFDLRPQNFDTKKSDLTWYPTGAWTKFDPKFRRGIFKVYDGFYLGNETVYREGLMEIGLMDSSWSEEDKKRLSDLFKEQFGDASTEDVHFTLDHFTDSMTKVFQFILEKRRKITKDFLYLGIYLITLYSTLEKVGAPLPVKSVYLRMRDLFSNELS